MADQDSGRREHWRWLARAHEEAEVRRRAEAGKPLPVAARLPGLSGDGAIVPDAVEYPLIRFPWEPGSLVALGCA